MTRRQIGFLWLAGYVLGCGGHDLHARMQSLVARGEYAEAAAFTRREPALEKELAAVLLEDAARSADPERRRRAFAELQLAGTRARPVLARLAESADPLARAHALRALAQLGDERARDALAPLADSSDPELSALGYAALDAADDRARLLAALTLPNRERRLSAVHVLADAEAAGGVHRALEATLRHDPDPSVRAAAAAALAGQGAAAYDALERALDDESQPVRLAAVHALGALDRHACAVGECSTRRELARLARELGSVPTPETLAASSVLLRATPAYEPDRARDVFSRALTSGDSALRARAAVLCRALRDPGCDAAVLRERVRREPAAEVRLLVALALGPSEPLGRAALATLARDPSTSVAIEAATELAVLGDPAGRAVLAEALRHTDPRVRVRALRALARVAAGGALSGDADAQLAERAAEHLADRDDRVRTAAAAAVLGFG